MTREQGRNVEKRPTANTWRLSRSQPLDQTVRDATRKTVVVYREALEKLAKY